ncbi:hypothetical protein [Bradyrhizobium genosp. P]|uniref:hypothetical protein n=1 Tax=Bradyrhizobium genosp. P TaxID=83641 RepID=UPI003CF6BD0D
MSTCSERVFAMARERFSEAFGPVGKIIAAERHAPDTHRDVSRSQLDQKLDNRRIHCAVVEDPLLRVNCWRAGALAAALCGEGAS